MEKRKSLSSYKIDKTSPIPLYYQLKEILSKWIKELCEIFQVSRSVVRQALGILMNEGFINRQRGRGTYIAKPKIEEHLISRLIGFYEDMISQGLIPKTKVLNKDLITATESLAFYLNIEVGEKLIRIERLRFVNDEPLLIVTTFIPYKLCPNLLEEDLENNSLYRILEEKYNIYPLWGERSLEVTLANVKEAKLLNINKDSPLIFLKSITYMNENIPFEYYEAKHKADRTKFISRLFGINKIDEKTINLLNVILNYPLKLSEKEGLKIKK
jgi:GntR family transcriptional regulator